MIIKRCYYFHPNIGTDLRLTDERRISFCLSHFAKFQLHLHNQIKRKKEHVTFNSFLSNTFDIMPVYKALKYVTSYSEGNP